MHAPKSVRRRMALEKIIAEAPPSSALARHEGSQVVVRRMDGIRYQQTTNSKSALRFVRKAIRRGDLAGILAP